MSELKMVSPLLDGVKILDRFSQRGQAECYACERTDSGEKLVLKHISIPGSEAMLQAMLLTGAAKDEAEANEYFRGLAEDLRSELECLKAMPESSGVSAWTDFQIEPREGVGFDVYALMPEKASLRTYLQENAITQLQALNLGLDLCDAMGYLNAAGYSYLDLKPENVFVDGRKRFSIGDLGLMMREGMEFAAIPEEHINDFSAPELTKLIPEPTGTSDQYSLGMLLFYIFNGNRLPFEDEKVSVQRAREKRLNSDILPSPQYADYELAEIISRACSRDPEKRYGSFAELKQELTLYMQRNEVSDQLLVPPLPVEAPEQAQESPAIPAEQIAGEPPDMEPADAEEAPALEQEERIDTAEEAPQIPDAPEALSESGQTPADEEPADAAKEPAEEDNSAPVEETVETQTDNITMVEEPEDNSEEIPTPEEEKAESQVDAIRAEIANYLAQEPEEELSEIDDALNLSDLANIEVPEDEPQQSIEELLASVSNVLSEQEQEPVAQAPDLEANEAAANEAEPKKRKKRKWVPWVIALLALALLGTALAYFYSNWYLVEMDALEVTERTADSITVVYNLSSPDPGITFECTDTYGNSYPGTAGEGSVQFKGLEPGTQYTVRFFPGKLHKLTGTTSTSAATATATEIVSMTAVQAADSSAAEITLVVSGPEPEQWLLTYSSTGSDSGSVSFSGHSVEIPGLVLHDTYTFELTSPEDVYLTGQTSCEMRLIADVQARDLQVSYATDDSLTVTWQNLADAPLAWTATCVGDGYDETQEVTECVATFRGIRLDTAYTFTVSAEGLEVPLSVSLPANARIVTDFTVEPTADTGSILVRWTSTDPQPEGGWVVRYLIGGDPSLGGSVSAQEQNEVLLTGMPANAEIVVSVEPKDGQNVIGVSTLTTETLEAEAFSGHEFASEDAELRLYSKPEGEEWTFEDLGDSAESFDPGATAAVVLTAPEDYTSDDEDETSVTLAVRGENGKLVQFRMERSAWNQLFTDRRYMTSFALTEQPGTYQLELYFDGKLVTQRVFTVVGTEQEQADEAQSSEEG